MTFTGNWLYDTFNNPLAVRRPRGQLPGLREHAHAPGRARRSPLLHFVVLGQRVTAATSDAERLKVETTAATLAATPDLTDLSAAAGLLDRQLRASPPTAPAAGPDPARSPVPADAARR